MWNNIVWLAPEIFLSTITVLLLGFGVIYSKLGGEVSQQKKITWLSIVTLLGTLLLVVDQYELISKFTTQNVIYITDASIFGVDSTILAIKIVILLGSIMVLVLSLDTYSIERKYLLTYEYTQLILLATLGMLLLISSKDLISLYLSIELVSLSLYILAAINREGQFSTEAGIKYFLLGSVASGILLLGAALIYWLTGETSFIGLTNYIWYSPLVENTNTVSLAVAAMFLIIALLFKLAAAPFHMWAPDVYEGSPTIVTAFFAIVPKIATLGILYELLIGPFQAILVEVKPFIIASALLSIIVGSLGAINQTKFKRLIAYSAIAHMGFMLLGLSTGSISGLIATFVYIVIYMITSLNTFTFLLSLNSNTPLVYISQLAGLSRINPTLAYTFALTLFSMAGIPPLAGFFSKYLVLMASINNQYYLISVIAIVFSVIGSFYYLRLIKWMFFKDSQDYQYKVLSNISLGNVAQSSISPIYSMLLGSTLYLLITFLFFPNVLLNFIFSSFSISLLV